MRQALPGERVVRAVCPVGNRNVLRHRARFCVSVVMGVFFVFGTVASASASTNSDPSTGKLTLVKTAFNFWDVACPPKGACIAVGQSQKNQGLVVPVSNGVPGRPATVPGTFGFGGAACPRANF